MELICVDGIPGVGKSTVIRALHSKAAARGLSTRQLHFFSDLPGFSGRGEGSSSSLEAALLKGEMTSSQRQRVFHELCAVASDALLRPRKPWRCDLMIVERSPLTLLAYSRAVLGRSVVGVGDFRAALATLRPVVICGDPSEAHARVAARDRGSHKGFLHALNVAELSRLQEAYLVAAREHDLEGIGSSDLAIESLEKRVGNWRRARG
jgi:thymidylate kinase